MDEIIAILERERDKANEWAEATRRVLIEHENKAARARQEVSEQVGRAATIENAIHHLRAVAK